MGLFGKRVKKEEIAKIEWNHLTDIKQLDEVAELSKEKAVLLFKHSTRCSISSMAISRLQREWGETEVVPYYLDLIAHRDISNEIANKFDVFHQSPQAIVIKNGKAVYDASHSGINFSDFSTL